MIGRVKISVEIDVATLIAIDNLCKAVKIERDDYINACLKERFRLLGGDNNG